MNPRMFVVMGVSGCGKSTVGQSLASAMDAQFLEGDDFHPAHNVARMAAGIALTDADRQDWLLALAERLSHARAGGQAVVLSCSALKRRYRDQLRAAAPGLMFIHLHGAPELIAARLAQRSDHYMPPSLLASQLADLEVPAPDEHAVTLEASAPVDAIVRTVIVHLQEATSP